MKSLFILYLLFVVLKLSNSQSFDYNCFYNLAHDSGSLDVFNTGVVYNFCYSGITTCNDNQTIVNEIYFTSKMVKNSSFIFTPSYFDCFIDLKILYITNLVVSSDFIYYKFKNLNSLSVHMVFQTNDPFTIDNYIPTLDYLTIGGNKTIENLNLKYFKNVTNLYFEILINNFVNDLDKPIQSIPFQLFNLISNSFPNFTNIENFYRLVININNYNLSSAPNIYTLVNIEKLSISPVYCIDFPPELANLNSNSLSDFSFNGCFSQFSKLYDLSNLSKLGDSLIVYITNTYFFCYKIGSDCYFPFSSFQKIASLNIEVANTYRLIDKNIFENITSVSLINNKVNSSLGTKDRINPTTFLLDNNLINGDIDDSWCQTILSVQNNSLTGEIPSCFKCYFNDSKIKNRFIGNQFTNFNTIEPCTTIVPSTLTISNGMVYINGTDLILISTQVNSTPQLDWSVITPSKSFGASITKEVSTLKTIDLLILETYKFTLPLVSQAPIISNISYTSSSTLIIQGTYFTYDKSLVSFKVGGVECQIQSATFYEIVCIPQDTTFETNKSASLTISCYPEIKLYLCTNVSFVNQMCQPTCDQNVACNMITSTCACGGQCLNGGGCVTETDKCSCTVDWVGSNCNITNHYVSSVSSTTVNGGLIELSGEFGDVHNSPSVMIGGFNCTISQINGNNILCNLPPTTSENSGTYQDVTVIQNSITWGGNNIFKYTETIKQCPKNCIDSNHGTCNTNTGACNCQPNWIGLDCAIRLDGGTEQPPKSNTTIDQLTGGTTINNQNTNYQILITSINELDFDGQLVKTIPLEGKWLFLNSSKNNQNDNNTITYFSQKYNQTTIISTIEEVSKSKQFSFAGVDFQVESGSLKFTISIQNWQYNSILNTLRLEMKSTVEQYSTKCQENTSISVNGINDQQTSSNLNYMTISKGDKIMYGRFIDKALSDSRPTFINSQVISQDKDSLVIGLNLPHCTNQCIVDPDFSVLTNVDFTSNCDSINSNKKWLIPVAVVVPIVGLSILIIIIYIIYKKNSTIIKIHLFTNLKLSKLKK